MPAHLRTDPTRSPEPEHAPRSQRRVPGPQAGLVFAAAAAMSAIALGDAVVHGLTGHSLIDVNNRLGSFAATLVHGVSYALFGWVLVAEAVRIDGGRPVRRWLRRLLAADLGILAVVFTTIVPIMILRSASEASIEAAVGGISTVAFLGMFLLSLALGVVTVGTQDLRPGAYLLVGVLPAIGLMIGLGALGSPFAHPGYAEAMVNFGIALLAWHRRDDSAHSRP